MTRQLREQSWIGRNAGNFERCMCVGWNKVGTEDGQREIAILIVNNDSKFWILTFALYQWRSITMDNRTSRSRGRMEKDGGGGNVSCGSWRKMGRTPLLAHDICSLVCFSRRATSIILVSLR